MVTLFSWTTGRVCVRYLERVKISAFTLFFFDIPTTALFSFPTPTTTSLLNDIESSVCNRILMVIHSIHVVSLLSTYLATRIRTFVHANPFYCNFVIVHWLKSLAQNTTTIQKLHEQCFSFKVKQIVLEQCFCWNKQNSIMAL